MVVATSASGMLQCGGGEQVAKYIGHGKLEQQSFVYLSWPIKYANNFLLRRGHQKYRLTGIYYVCSTLVNDKLHFLVPLLSLSCVCHT